MLRIVSVHQLKISVIALSVLPQVLSFSSPRSTCITRITTHQSSIRPTLTIKHTQMIDDDGWGDKKTTAASEPILSFRDSDRVAKSKELERLQSGLVDKNTSSAGGDTANRDLFIPIFTLVAVVGFAGLYGYEMLRLYSRGELYLPWQNK